MALKGVDKITDSLDDPVSSNIFDFPVRKTSKRGIDNIFYRCLLCGQESFKDVSNITLSQTCI